MEMIVRLAEARIRITLLFCCGGQNKATDNNKQKPVSQRIVPFEVIQTKKARVSTRAFLISHIPKNVLFLSIDKVTIES